MRRILASLTGLVLLSSVLGCNHTAGRCDCADYTPCAGACCLGGDGPIPNGGPIGGHVIQAEPLKAMPKEAGKE
jgi:hypothetical protein